MYTNIITYIKSSHNKAYFRTQHNIYQLKFNRMPPASPRSPTPQIGLNDGAEKCQENRRPTCRSTTTKTEFKISKPRVLFGRTYEGVCLLHGNYRLRTSSPAGQTEPSFTSRKENQSRVPERDP